MMHEATIASFIVNSVADKCVFAGGVATTVHVRAGTFRNIDPDALTFAFDAIKDLKWQTVGCELELEMVQAQATCRGLGHVYSPSMENAFACPICGGSIDKLTAGEELEITKVTINA
jgi:hydrogenase nickel incorporation protein HypA/HybF